MSFKIVLAKFFVFIAAMQILNLSIYAQDIDMLQQKGTLTYNNDINTIAEFIGEVLLKHVNEFPEYPNDGHKDLQFSKHIDINSFSFQSFKAQQTPVINLEYLVPHKIDYNYLFFKEINPPPPKA